MIAQVEWVPYPVIVPQCCGAAHDTPNQGDLRHGLYKLEAYLPDVGGVQQHPLHPKELPHIRGSVQDLLVGFRRGNAQACGGGQMRWRGSWEGVEIRRRFVVIVAFFVIVVGWEHGEGRSLLLPWGR